MLLNNVSKAKSLSFTLTNISTMDQGTNPLYTVHWFGAFLFQFESKIFLITN